MKNLLKGAAEWVQRNSFYIFFIPLIFILGFVGGSFHTFVSSEVELIKQHHINLEEKALRMQYEIIIESQQTIILNQQQTLDTIKKWMEDNDFIPKTRSEASYNDDAM